MKVLRPLIINSILTIIFILVMAMVNLKVNKIEVELRFFILPIFLGALLGTIITYFSVKRARYLEEMVKEKTKELEYYASIDEMTNIYNRRIGLEMLRNHFNLSKRQKDSLAICLVDIDGLKYINDNFGHTMGDKLIKDISRILKSSIRESDIVSRMGGDEFLIIFPRCSADDAREVMRRLTEKIKRYNEVSQNCYKASVSFGVSGFSGNDDRTIKEVLVEADNKMYTMKKNVRPTFHMKSYSNSRKKVLLSKFGSEI